MEDATLNLPTALRKGNRCRSYYPMSNYISFEKLGAIFKTLSSNLTDINIPTNIQEAFNGSSWKKVVEEELHAL